MRLPSRLRPRATSGPGPAPPPDRRRPEPNDPPTVVIALIDVDRIERVDEAVGRRDRDYMLGLVESRLRANLRPTDTLLRRNDHEFALVSDAPHHAERICRRLLETVAEPIEGRGRSFWLTASIGATCSRVVDDPTDHIRFAGDALRQAKDRGGDCCVVLEDR